MTVIKNYENRFIYNEDTEFWDFGVYDVQIDIPTEPLVVLHDQVFVRNP